MNKTQKELKFIHITKTAGTSIEDIALKNNIKWGRFDLEYYSDRRSWWHELFTLKSIKLKEKYDWFMVVRNPFTRIISEFNYCTKICKLEINDITEFNNFIYTSLCNFLENKDNHYQNKTGDHFTPQYMYLDSCCIIHILKFENIENEFNSLMIVYGYPLNLNEHKNKSSESNFKISDLSPLNIELIKRIYHEDFIRFNYNKDEY